MSTDYIKNSKTTFDRHDLYEECALCHRITEVKADTPVEYREYYVRARGSFAEDVIREHTAKQANKDGEVE